MGNRQSQRAATAPGIRDPAPEEKKWQSGKVAE
jgi:hypothetical protein